jgi:hypothetical protein
MKKSLFGRPEHVSPNHTRKISEVLTDFVHENLPASFINEDMEGAIELAAVVWNIGLLDKESQGAALMAITQKMGRNDPVFNSELNRMLQARLTKYGDDRRNIQDFKLEEDKHGDVRLIVASVDMAPPAKPQK